MAFPLQSVGGKSVAQTALNRSLCLASEKLVKSEVQSLLPRESVFGDLHSQCTISNKQKIYSRHGTTIIVTRTHKDCSKTFYPNS